MRWYQILIASSLLVTACKKSRPERPAPVEPLPVMAYSDLHEAKARDGAPKVVDIDGDGQNDFLFGVQLVGDPVLQRDRLQFIVRSGLKRNLLNDANDETPVFKKTDAIGKSHQGFEWWELSTIVLAEKITRFSGSNWEGGWKNASHDYLAVQLDHGGKIYHGWIEISFSTVAEELILHRCAISVEEGKTVKAGL